MIFRFLIQANVYNYFLNVFLNIIKFLFLFFFLQIDNLKFKKVKSIFVKKVESSKKFSKS